MIVNWGLWDQRSSFHIYANILYRPYVPNILVALSCTKYSSSIHAHQIFCSSRVHQIFLFPSGAPGSRPLPRTKPWNLPPSPAPGDRSGGEIDLWSHEWSLYCSKCLHQDADNTKKVSSGSPGPALTRTVVANGQVIWFLLNFFLVDILIHK